MSRMKVFATNKRARFDYDITETMMAGIVLSGPETKSVRGGGVSLRGSFIAIQGDEAYLTNAHINPYPHAQGLAGYEPTSRRKLLVHRRELSQLIAAKNAGFGVVPLAIGASGRYLKIEVGIGRGKKRHDKRQTIKERETTRQMRRDIKRV